MRIYRCASKIIRVCLNSDRPMWISCKGKVHPARHLWEFCYLDSKYNGDIIMVTKVKCGNNYVIVNEKFGLRSLTCNIANTGC